MTIEEYRQHGTYVQLLTGDNALVTSDNPLYISAADAYAPHQFVDEYFMSASGPTGTTGYDMNVNASITPAIFEYAVPAGELCQVYRINFVISDASIGPNAFGGIIGGLTNGILLQAIDADGSTVLHSFGEAGGEPVPIKTNADFAPLAGSETPIEQLAGDDMLPIRIGINRHGGKMVLNSGERIRVTVRDDLTAITKFRGVIQGLLNP